MGQVLSLAQLQAWAHDSVGSDAMDRFVFLGKGFFYAHCTSPRYVLQLVAQQMVCVTSFYAHSRPGGNSVFPPFLMHAIDVDNWDIMLMLVHLRGGQHTSCKWWTELMLLMIFYSHL